MFLEQNKLLPRRFMVEAFGQGQLGLLDDLLASTFVDHDVAPGTPPGRDGIRYALSSFRTAFPDIKVSVQDEIAEGEKVAIRYTVSGTQLGDLFGIAASGRPVVIDGINIYRIAGGQM